MFGNNPFGSTPSHLSVYPPIGGHHGVNLFQQYYCDSSNCEVSDNKSKASWENDNYEIEFTDAQSAMKITNKHTGEIYRVYNDPYIGLGDKDNGGGIAHKGEFKHDSVLILDDGTQIHMDTKEKSAGGQTFLDTVTIFEPCHNKATQICGLLSNENDLHINKGSLHEYINKTGVDYNQALRFKEAFGEKDGLFIHKPDGGYHQIKTDSTAADNTAIIQQIEAQLKQHGYNGAADIWGCIKPDHCNQFCDWLIKCWFDQICHMFGNSCGVGNFNPCVQWPMPGCHPCTPVFYNQMQQFAQPGMQFPQQSAVTGPDVWALMGGANFYQAYKA
ncbi:hypothetical protein CS022_20000 [Veronia nyctiphanis]|uniref:DUF1521 domain-containing protein n=1 Tax=Veronia nyctiphanis TaxID=1278244 RepID=A0A4Q0YMR9_9GAMM|nr:DUF1521 domain-containing protein [Veronia nyctiphanis]RXJ71733.1 hypothetical protein CS022_20000 [Veronia nyctiphanis]